jgi:hypothetical protein
MHASISLTVALNRRILSQALQLRQFRCRGEEEEVVVVVV